jgi:predicted RNase H-like nuclease (RuvC/YqgF family)
MAFENISISLIVIGSAILGSLLRPVVAYVLGLKQHSRETVKIETEADLKVVVHEDDRADKALQKVIDTQEARIEKLEIWLERYAIKYMDCEAKSAALEERVRHCERMEEHRLEDRLKLEREIAVLRDWLDRLRKAGIGEDLGP